MDWQNNIELIRHNLLQRQTESLALLEQQRLKEKLRVVELLKRHFQNILGCKVWLFGSILRSNSFTPNSDIDIAVKGYTGSRLDLFPELEKLLNHNIDLVIMEKSGISDEIELNGEQIV